MCVCPCVCVCVFVCLLVCVFVCLAVCNVLFASVLVCLSVVFVCVCVCVCVFELVFVFTPCVGDPVRMCAHVACRRYAFARFVFVLGLCLCQRVSRVCVCCQMCDRTRMCVANCLLFWCW
jgi:hypothetical protein